MKNLESSKHTLQSIASSLQVTLWKSPLWGHTPILEGHDSLKALTKFIEESQPDKLFVLSDPTILKYHQQRLFESFPSTIRSQVETITIPCGEQNKSLGNLEYICQTILNKGGSKRSLLLNFGGGVVLNIGGLAASLLYRGIPFIHVPTTFLAQSDVIVSNKQSVNFAGSKNKLGCFTPAHGVFLTTEWVHTEPPRQVYAALVEYCKNALILGKEHYSTALATLERIQKSPSCLFEELPGILRDSLKQKFIIAELDPHEGGEGLILEYGHTAGHALEQISEGSLFHGEAVWHGMHVAGRIAQLLGVFSKEDLKKQQELLNLIPNIPNLADTVPHLGPKRWLQGIHKDNKKIDAGFHWILLSAVGRIHRTGKHAPLTPVSQEITLQALQEYCHAVL